MGDSRSGAGMTEKGLRRLRGEVPAAERGYDGVGRRAGMTGLLGGCEGGDGEAGGPALDRLGALSGCFALLVGRLGLELGGEEGF